MGKIASKFVDYFPDSLAIKISEAYHRRTGKRKRNSTTDEDAQLIESLHSPKRKKLQCTADYIYQTLFIEGKDSDVTVNLLDRSFKLHKLYLGQSRYFSSMFSGSWNETNMSSVDIAVEDPNVTVEALETVFGSFYLDEVKLEPRQVVEVLAAATLFQLDGLIEQCCEIMYESVCPLTAVKYYEAACRYGAQKVKDTVMHWFSVNFVDYYTKNYRRLKEINFDLMLAIVSEPGLCVIQTETALYLLLKTWLFMECEPGRELEPGSADNYFSQLEGSEPFLLTERGLRYISIFKYVRIWNMLLNLQDTLLLIKDRIIPNSWLDPSFRKQWISLLSVFSGSSGPENADEKRFSERCYRCGRVVREEDALSWRWGHFSFGVDLVWILADTSLSLRRPRANTDLAFQSGAHHVLVRVELMNLDERRQVKKLIKSDLLSFHLSRGQEVKILNFDKLLYPLYVIINFLVFDVAKD